MKKTMRRFKKTYAIYHLTEKHTVFYLGKTRVHVSFTGGIVTKKGVTPATFTTDDPIVQLAIEQSADFKGGAIKLRSKYPMEGEVNIGHNPLPVLASEPEAVATQGGEEASEPVEKEPEAETAPQATEVAEREEKEPETEAAPDEPEAAKGLTVVEVSCKDVAKQYLQEHYGENPAPLRTRDAVQECAAKYGITFDFV